MRRIARTITLLFFMQCSCTQWKVIDVYFFKTPPLEKQGKYQEALALANETIAATEKELGTDHPYYAGALLLAGWQYQKLGQYDKAADVYERALTITRKTTGFDRVFYDSNVHCLGDLYIAMGRYAEAEPLCREGIELWRKRFGEHDFYYQVTVNNLALLYHEMGRYPEAEPLFKKSLAIEQGRLFKNYTEIATITNNLANLYSAMGRYAEAEACYKEAMEMRRRELGEEHPDFSTSLTCLAGLHSSLGRYGDAEQLFKRSLEVRRKTLGEAHPYYAGGLGCLAGLYVTMGRYAEAEVLYKKGIEIQRKALGERHPKYASSLNSLAGLYVAMGQYAKAEPIYRRAMGITEAALGRNHPQYAAALGSLANYLRCMGRFSEAEPLYKEALEIRQKALGGAHPNVACAMNDLALIYANTHRHADATKLYESAVEIWRKALGGQHPQCATGLNNLALQYAAMGRQDDARRLLENAAEIWRKTLGEDHPTYALSLGNLGWLCGRMGRYDEGESLCKKAVAIWQKGVGEEHPSFAIGLMNLAALHAATDRHKEALPVALQALDIQLGILSRVFAISSEKQKSQFLALIRPNFDSIQSHVLMDFGTNPSTRTAGLHALLRTKAITLEAMMGRQSALIRGGDPQVRQMADELRSTYDYLASLALGKPGDKPLAAYQDGIAKAKKRQEQLEAELSKRSEEFGLMRRLRNVTVETVRSCLPRDSVLVTLCRTYVENFKAKGNEARWLPPRYIVYVLSKDAEAPTLIDLADAGAVDLSVRAFRKAVQDPDEDVQQAAQRLYTLVFAPIEKHIPKGSRLLISPDGELSLVPFEAFHNGSGFLLDQYRISYLDTGRDLIRLAEKQEARGHVAILCDPDFDLDGRPNRPVEVASARRSVDSGDLHFERLPATREEGQEVSRLFESKNVSVDRREGAQAMERVLKDIKGPRVLHLATHGFFLNDLKRASDDRGVTADAAAPLMENPLLRSGLALAGANRKKTEASGGDDGIATALEISGIDLGGTELVVLSACDTGVGEIKVGEGLFGLRRAIICAGARSIVMSLWKVDDRATRLLMEQFYENWSRGMPKAQALHEAKRWLMNHEEEVVDTDASLLRGRKVKIRKRVYAHPMYWAPFVLIGDWR